MRTLDQLLALNDMLLSEQPQYRAQAAAFPPEPASQWRLFRALVNIRAPRPVSEAFLALQDSLLKAQIAEKGVTTLDALTPLQGNLYLWKGDITTLQVDGIVNAANSGLTGCYCPGHSCIDNAIHTFAGVQLRLECAAMMQAQGHPDPVGTAKITKAYNLPCRAVLHTVGPMVTGKPSERDRASLAACYRACLELAALHALQSLAFCCISTGVFHFPRQEAAEIAVGTVKAYWAAHPGMSIVFNVFQDEDEQIYRRLLNR